MAIVNAGAAGSLPIRAPSVFSGKARRPPAPPPASLRYVDAAGEDPPLSGRRDLVPSR